MDYGLRGGAHSQYNKREEHSKLCMVMSIAVLISVMVGVTGR